ncbi:MAG TPA: hypothetical protein VGI39_18045 [Polyangiaceae bacterium]
MTAPAPPPAPSAPVVTEVHLGVVIGWQVTARLSGPGPLASLVFDSRFGEVGAFVVGVDLDEGVFLSDPPVTLGAFERSLILLALRGERSRRQLVAVAGQDAFDPERLKEVRAELAEARDGLSYARATGVSGALFADALRHVIAAVERLAGGGS